jgi:hypothetical protein
MGSVWEWLHRRFGGLQNRRTPTAVLPVKRRSPLCLEKVAWLMLKATPRKVPFSKLSIELRQN